MRRPGPGKKRSGESDRPEMVKVALLIVNLASSASKTEKISDQTGNNARAHATNARHRQTAMPMATALCRLCMRLWSPVRAPLVHSLTSPLGREPECEPEPRTRTPCGPRSPDGRHTPNGDGKRMVTLNLLPYCTFRCCYRAIRLHGLR